MQGWVHERQTLLLLRQHIGREILQQRAKIISEQLGLFQYLVDISLLQDQPVPTGSECIRLPHHPLMLAHLCNQLPRGTLSESVQVQQDSVGALAHGVILLAGIVFVECHCL